MSQLTKREKAIALRVRTAREGLQPRLTQQDIGDALGLSQVGYSHYEAYRVPFSVEQVFKLSQILGRSIEYFLGINNELTPDQDEFLTLYKNLLTDQARHLTLRILRILASSEREEDESQ